MNEATCQLLRGVLLILEVCEQVTDPQFVLAATCLWLYWSYAFGIFTI